MTRWNGRCRWTPRSPACTSTAPPSAGTQGAGSSYTNPCHRPGGLEPPDHAIGRSRGGVTCKIHLATDGKGRPLGLVLTGGNAALPTPRSLPPCSTPSASATAAPVGLAPHQSEC